MMIHNNYIFFHKLKWGDGSINQHDFTFNQDLGWVPEPVQPWLKPADDHKSQLGKQRKYKAQWFHGGKEHTNFQAKNLDQIQVTQMLF